VGRKSNKKLVVISLILFATIIFVIDFFLGLLLIPEIFTGFRVRHPYYHHDLKPNVEQMAAWGPIIYPFYTNKYGFRDFPEKETSFSDVKKRILILGDSHSEGVGVDYQFTFAGRLQQAALTRNIEIMNASAVSYSPKIHFLKADYLLNRKGLKVDEIWVIIDISDLQNEIAYRQFKPRLPYTGESIVERLVKFTRNHSFVVYSIEAILNKRKNETLAKALSGLNQAGGQLPTETAIELYKEFFRNFDNEDLLRDPNFHGVSEWIYNEKLREFADQGLQLGFSNISALNRICREKGIACRLSVHPWQTQVVKGDTTDYYVESWREFCQSEGIDFINLYPLFVTEENPLWVAKTCYIEGDNHWNETGHARVARYFEKYLN